MACQILSLPLASLGETPNTPIGKKNKKFIYGGKIIENKTTSRTRPYAYTFRATAEEKELIDSKIKASGLTMTEFIIRAIKNKPVTVINSGGEILAELKRQGNNLNQAVKNIYFNDISERELLSVIKGCKDLYKKLSETMRGA